MPEYNERQHRREVSAAQRRAARLPDSRDPNTTATPEKSAEHCRSIGEEQIADGILESLRAYES